MSVESEAPTMRPLTLGPRLLEGLVVAVGRALSMSCSGGCSEFGGLCSLRHW